MSQEFLVVRNLVPSVNNLVAIREMLFEDIFNNLSKGFNNQNMEYINFCFGHLLATFIYANRTSDDLMMNRARLSGAPSIFWRKTCTKN